MRDDESMIPDQGIGGSAGEIAFDARKFAPIIIGHFHPSVNFHPSRTGARRCASNPTTLRIQTLRLLRNPLE